MGLPAGLAFRTKGQLATGILAGAFAGGVRLDVVCGDQVYGAHTELRDYLKDHDQAYVLRVPSSFRLILAGAITVTGKQATARLPSRRGWEIRSAGIGAPRTTLVRLGMAGHRLPAAPPADPPPPGVQRTGLSLLLPARQPAGIAVAAGPRRRAALASRENFEFGKSCFGPGQSQVCLYTAIARHTVLAMAAPAICAVTTALLRRRTSTQSPAPVLPDQPPVRRPRDHPAHHPRNWAPRVTPMPDGHVSAQLA
jgi:hypothetical protein